MFYNIGKKLQGLALFLCWGGILSSVIGGITLIRFDMVLIGILTMIFGSLFSWISSWVTYAIGEIAENTEKKCDSHTSVSFKPDSTENASAPSQPTWFTKPSAANASSDVRCCPHCGEIVRSSICEMCGKENNLFQ